MSKLHVGIIFGGVSHEHDVSLESAKNIAHVIDRDRFKVTMIRVNKNGTWCKENTLNTVFLRYFKSVTPNIFRYVRNVLNNRFLEFRLYDIIYNGHDIFSNIDVVFPIVHGFLGEDGALQGLLKIKKIPYVGSGVLGSALSMDKDFSKRLLRDSGLMVAPFVTFNSLDDMSNGSFEYCVDTLGLPLFVKPSSQGSSIGVSKVVDSRSFYRAVHLAFSLDRKVLVESAIVGRELECAVLGNKHPKVSVCGEVILKKNSFYTYQNKYFPQKGDVKVIIPAKISNEISNEIHRIVLRTFRVLQCCGMARVDVFLTSDSRVIVNEVNTLPGFTLTSMYPKLWEFSGLSCKELVSRLIKLALEEDQINKKSSL